MSSDETPAPADPRGADAKTEEWADVLTTDEICALVGVPRSTLNRWGAGGLVEPSFMPSDGKRRDRYWSAQDLVTVRTIKALRDAGCPLRQIKLAREQVAALWESELAEMMLVWDGNELAALAADELTGLVRYPGQLMLHIVAIPLVAWRDSAQKATRRVDLAPIRRRREALRKYEPESAARILPDGVCDGSPPSGEPVPDP